MRLTKIIISLFLFTLLSFSQGIDKKQHQSYPLLFNLVWGGGCDWWQNQFDWNLTVYSDSIPVMRAQNAYGMLDSIYWSFTTDWNAGEPLNKLMTIPDQWYVRTATGSKISYGGTYLVDPTNYCPQVNGKRFNEKLADTLAVFANPRIWDGVNSDGTWAYPYQDLGTIDLDRNGIADYNEISHGTTVAARKAWICQTWAAGYYTLANRLRAKTGWTNKLLTYWTVKDSMGMHVFNGAGWENAPQNAPVTFDVSFSDASLNGYDDWKQIVDDWNNVALSVSPRMNYLSATMYPEASNANCPQPFWQHGKEWYRYMRWTLGMALMTDTYYNIQDADASSGSYDHSASFYYDEFKSSLGKPLANGLYHIASNTVWVRFFDNGAVIQYAPSSTAASSVTVTDAMISSLTGYNGPYYRMYSNQDTAWNNGSKFGSVTLTAVAPLRWHQGIGDALILKKTQDTVICPIIVDNAYAGTTPGSNQAVLTNFSWDQGANTMTALDYNPTYNVGYRGSTDARWYRSHIASAGSGSATAVYTPGINREGYWRVYEWHGWAGERQGSYVEASNVPCRISYAGGYKDTVINQRINYGKWNLLGTYPYTPTGNKSLTITNNTDGVVIADAFMWEFVTSSVPPTPTIPIPVPNNPPNGSFNQPTSPKLIWRFTQNALSYSLKVSTDSLFSPTAIIVNDSTITDTTYQLSGLAKATKFFWTVRVKIDAGVSSYSPIQTFTTLQNGDAVITVEKGWNIVSVPYKLQNVSTSTVFSTAISSAYRYEGNFIVSDTVSPKIGYWLKFEYDQQIAITGSPILADTFNLMDGWNLIGSIAQRIEYKNLRTDQPDLELSILFQYKDLYLQDSAITPGEGYWIKANKAGSIFLSAQATESTYSIKMVATDELPPLPPESGTEPGENIPNAFSLRQNYPNPFNPSTTIEYDIPTTTRVKMSIFNALGQEVAVLVDAQEDPGRKQIQFNAGNLPSGLYLCRLMASGYLRVRKMILLK
jgi:hypothetical protein